MDPETLKLFIIAGFGCIALFFTILGVSTPGWGGDYTLFGCSTCGGRAIAIGVLLIFVMFILMIAVSLIVLIARRRINNPSPLLRISVLALLIVATIFTIIAYSQALSSIAFYSYHVTVTAGVFAYISTICFAYWAGSTSTSNVH